VKRFYEAINSQLKIFYSLIADMEDL
jgi:hypothetical protein